MTRCTAIPLLEPLEPRTLLAAWGPLPQLIDQDQAALRFKSIQGQGQSVAIIDSGVNYKHPALGGQWGKTVIAGHDFVDRDKDPMDTSGHGTQIASIIAASPFSDAEGDDLDGGGDAAIAEAGIPPRVMNQLVVR